MWTNRQKRVIKRTVKIINKHKADRMVPPPKVKGLIHDGFVTPDHRYPESTRVYAIFDRTKIRLGEIYREIDRIMHPHGYNLEPSYYSPTGQHYQERARVRIFPTRIVVIQHRGIDC